MSGQLKKKSRRSSVKSIRSLKWKLKYFFKKLKKRHYFSLNQLDKKLEKYVNYNNGFFVELGANDGVSQSNSLYFELNRNWRGVLIEPSPHNFLLCRQHRSIENHIFCNACVSFDYKDKYVDMKYAGLMSVSENLDLDLADKNAHIQSGIKYLPHDEELFAFGALAATLTSLLKESNAPKEIDFLSLDVEGAELEVLKGINFNEYSFKFMLIEIRDFKRVETYLAAHGYILEQKFSEHDYLFRHADI